MYLTVCISAPPCSPHRNAILCIALLVFERVVLAKTHSYVCNPVQYNNTTKYNHKYYQSQVTVSDPFLLEIVQ